MSRPVAAAVEVPNAGESPLLREWRRLVRWPAGRWLFSRLVGRRARYSGTVRPFVRALAPGRATVEFRDRPAVRNHLRSIHACALATAGELASGLALLAAVPAEGRAILVGVEIDYLKKARGPITAEGHAPERIAATQGEVTAHAVLRDAEGSDVARLRARWLVGPRPR
ncbi:MAG: DUF4442 domain-containing protein [Acidobacteria bacterium]|nr:MAG: DUF4442 domain-containing protein [Acidobacteriota bacterium]